VHLFNQEAGVGNAVGDEAFDIAGDLYPQYSPTRYLTGRNPRNWNVRSELVSPKKTSRLELIHVRRSYRSIRRYNDAANVTRRANSSGVVQRGESVARPNGDL
jgi:hypothetical protein